MKLYAWIGEDELGSGTVGLKQGLTNAGVVPLVAIDREKIDRPAVFASLQAQADRYGKTIRLVAFELLPGDLVTIKPRPQG